MNSALGALNLQQTTHTLNLNYTIFGHPFLIPSAVFNIHMSLCHLIAMCGVSPVVGRFTSYQADVIAFAALIAKRQILLR